MSNAWSGGSTRAWRDVRARVLRRDDFLCRLRIDGVCTTYAPMRGGHVHHVHGKGQCPGCRADRPDHLLATCAACNLHVGEPTEARADRPNRGVTRW